MFFLPLLSVGIELSGDSSSQGTTQSIVSPRGVLGAIDSHVSQRSSNKWLDEAQRIGREKTSRYSKVNGFSCDYEMVTVLHCHLASIFLSDGKQASDLIKMGQIITALYCSTTSVSTES